MGDDPTKIFKREATQSALEKALGGGENKELDKGMNIQPEGNAANNAVRGMRGGEEESNDLVSLGNQMAG